MALREARNEVDFVYGCQLFFLNLLFFNKKPPSHKTAVDFRERYKMLLAQRVKSAVNKGTGAVVFRHDLAPLGGATQLSVALRGLIADGVLVRIGEGIYAKAARDKDGRVVPVAKPQDLIREVLRKLRVKFEDVCIEDEGARKRVIIDASKRKIDRHLELGNCEVVIVTRTAMSKSYSLPEDPAFFPQHNVGKYIEVIARRHRISKSRTGLDRWAEAVSRAAGDSVQLDSVGRLLAKLKQQHVINGRQMAHLMNNYILEHREAEHDV
ncbi:hypothetical protein [Comamonas thiooxydans]|uniref:hypothetical protein n=1 Tax=Comamonas thiooxydans TaxID=363952 RepID=UPI00209C1A73|nr:hypothetical protein [Comamonas thiooxydans]MCO8251831.1 hypothetical protein [Comamonas thiooxydans]